jgi:uncharacterized membrane protein YdfJ with MMPL/SSD domain
LTGAAFFATDFAAGLAADLTALTGVLTVTGFLTAGFATALGVAAVFTTFLAGTGFLEAVFLDLAFTESLLAVFGRTGVLDESASFDTLSRLWSGARDCSHKPQGFIKLVKTNKIHQTNDCSKP